MMLYLLAWLEQLLKMRRLCCQQLWASQPAINGKVLAISRHIKSTQMPQAVLTLALQLASALAAAFFAKIA